MSFLAGMMIALGCVLYLNIGGPLGAFCFAIGLMSVVLYNMKLFTGKAGLVVKKQIKPWELGIIWCGNLGGVALMVLLINFLPNYNDLVISSQNIMMIREQVGFLGSLLLAIPCGMLMYMAVSVPEQQPMKLFYVCMCVLAFIMGGFYHCVADMFYTLVGAQTVHQYFNILFVTVGNFIGCNLVPSVQKIFGEL